MKQQIQNLKFRIQKGQPRMEHGQNTDLETKLNRRKRSERRSEAGAARTEYTPYRAKAGKGGKEMAWKWEKAGKNRRFFPDRGMVSRLFPPFPSFSRLFPRNFFWPSGAWNRDGKWSAGVLELWRDRVARSGERGIMREN